MVDPLDGTNGFIDGNGDFAVQIGLSEDGECVLGVVYHPPTGTLYRAVRGEGTWIERPQFDPERAHVQTRPIVEHASGRESLASQSAHEQSGESFWFS